jgi:exopolysaccharide production protein ExoQ
MNSLINPRKRKGTRKAVTWAIFIFIFMIIFFARPYNLFLSIERKLSSVELSEEIIHGNPVRMVALIIFGGFALVSLMAKKGYRIRINGFLGGLIIFFLCWAVCSLSWADDPILTLRRLIILIALSIGALAIAARFSIRELLVFVLFGCCLTLLLGLGAEIALGTFHPFDAAYRFAGVIPYNAQARNCAILFFAALVISRKAKRGRILLYITEILALSFLILTKSRMEFISILIISYFYWRLISTRYHKKSYLQISCVLMVFSIFLIAFIIFSDEFIKIMRFAALLGRDDSSITTFTGRIPVWKVLLRYLADSNFFGYGYNAFWTPAHIYGVEIASGYFLGHAHSIYLEMALGIGVIGAGSFAVMLAYATMKYLSLFKTSGNIDYAFCVSLLGYVILTSFMNSEIAFISIPTIITFALLARIGFVDDRFHPSLFA